MSFTTRHTVLILLIPVLSSGMDRGQTPGRPDAESSFLEEGRALLKKFPDSAISSLMEARSVLSVELKAESDLLLMQAFGQKGNMDSAMFFGQEAIDLSRISGNKDRQAFYSSKLARMLRNAGEAEKAKTYYVRALDIYDNLSDVENIASIENSIGIACKKQGQYAEALTHYRRSLRTRTELGQKQKIAQVVNNIGNVLRYQGELDSALSMYYEALRVFEELADSTDMSNALNNIGLVHKMNGNDSLALTYYRRVQRIRSKLNDVQGLNSALNNIAIIYLKLGKTDSALTFFKQTLDYALEHGQQDAEALARHNIASVYMDAGNWIGAESGFRESLQIRKRLKDDFGVVSCNQNLAECYRRMGRYELAIRYAQTALGQSKKIGSKIQQTNILATIHESFAALGQFDQAYRYQTMKHALYDSIYEEDRLTAITEMQAKYENDKKQQEIELGQKQNALQQEKIKRQQSTRNFLFALIALGLVIMLALLSRARSLDRINRALAEQKAELATSAQEKAMLLNEVHHRVKNNLQVVSSLLSMQSREVEDQQVLNALRQGRDRVRSMALIHQMFYEDKDDSVAISMSQYIGELCRSLMTSYGAEEKGIQLDLTTEQCSIDVDRATFIGLIINELVTNTLKYAFADGSKGMVTVSISLDDNNCILQVSDNGIGTTQKSTTGKSSFGLKLVTSLVKKLNGTLETTTENGYSTRIVFPKNKRP